MSRRGMALYELIGDRPVGRRPGGEEAGGVSEGEAPRGGVTTPELKRSGGVTGGGGVGSVRRGVSGGGGATPAVSAPARVGGGVAGAGGGNRFVDGDEGGGLAAMLAPGRVIRVPVGYVWFGVAALVLVGVVGWAIGYSSGERAMEREIAASRVGELPSAADDPENDPFAGFGEGGAAWSGADEGAAGGGGGADVGGGDLAGAIGGGVAGGDDDGGEVDGAGDVVGPMVHFLSDRSEDPREVGLNYYTLVSSFPADDAREVAAFAADRGVAVVGVPVGRGRFTVTTLRGISGGEYRSNGATRRALEAAVRNAGRAYRAAGGSTAFEDAFWDKLD